MELEERVDTGEQSEITADSKAKPGRRRFIGGAGAIVPVVLTVGSRSVLANVGGGGCFSPSASASINLLHSRPGRTTDGNCGGKTPGLWKNAYINFGNTLAHNTKWSSKFTVGPFTTNTTMEDVCGTIGNANNAALARHLAAAWCNLASGLVASTVLDLSDLQAMWNARDGVGSGYHPTAGVTWFDSDMVTYLLTTQPL